MDHLTKKQRSYLMSTIKGKWTKQERLVHNYLKGTKIKHRMHPHIIGNPDIILIDKKIAIFLDGCFWHGCARCYKRPTSNTKYWDQKFIMNKKKAKYASSVLRKDGWEVIRIWEHEINNKSKLKSRMQFLN